MKSARSVCLLLTVLASLSSISACTSRHWFEGMQASARQQCQRSADAEAARRCEDDVNHRKYDDYEKDRPK